MVLSGWNAQRSDLSFCLMQLQQTIAGQQVNLNMTIVMCGIAKVFVGELIEAGVVGCAGRSPCVGLLAAMACYDGGPAWSSNCSSGDSRAAGRAWAATCASRARSIPTARPRGPHSTPDTAAAALAAMTMGQAA